MKHITILFLWMVKLSHTRCVSYFMSHQWEESKQSSPGLLLLVLVTNPFLKLLFRDMTFKSDSWRSLPPQLSSCELPVFLPELLTPLRAEALWGMCPFPELLGENTGSLAGRKPRQVTFKRCQQNFQGYGDLG